MLRYLETRTSQAIWIFDLADAFVQRLQGPASHPRPYEPLVFELTAREQGGVMVDLPVPRRLVVTTNPSGYHLFFGQWRHADGTMRRLSLDPGRYRIRISGPGYQPLVFEVPLPMPARERESPGDPDPWAAFSQTLQPAGAYPFPQVPGYRPQEDPGPCGASVLPTTSAATRLRGALYHPDGRGRDGATVEISGRSNQYTVGPDGQWVLWFEPGDTGLTGLHTVTITLADGSDASVPDVCVVRGRETSLPATALRGWVLRDGAGVANAQVAVSGFGATVTTRVDGAWYYYFLPNQSEQDVTVTVTLPTGESQSADSRIKSRGTVVVPSFHFSSS